MKSREEDARQSSVRRSMAAVPNGASRRSFLVHLFYALRKEAVVSLPPVFFLSVDNLNFARKTVRSRLPRLIYRNYSAIFRLTAVLRVTRMSRFFLQKEENEEKTHAFCTISQNCNHIMTYKLDAQLFGKIVYITKRMNFFKSNSCLL